MLDTLRSPPAPSTLGEKVQALDDEMMTILDRKDLDDRTKVTLYNQVLQRYNILSDKHVKEPVRVVAVNESGSIEEARHPSLLHAQRVDEGEPRGKIRQNVEDAHVAILHETSDVAIHRRPSGLCAIVLQHHPPQYRYGSITGKYTESRTGVAASVRSRR